MFILRDQPSRRRTQVPYVRVPYPSCAGVPRPHDHASCSHCREFIRSNGPYLQELAQTLNKLIDLVDGAAGARRRQRSTSRTSTSGTSDA